MIEIRDHRSAYVHLDGSEIGCLSREDDRWKFIPFFEPGSLAPRFDAQDLEDIAAHLRDRNREDYL